MKILFSMHVIDLFTHSHLYTVIVWSKDYAYLPCCSRGVLQVRNQGECTKFGIWPEPIFFYLIVFIELDLLSSGICWTSPIIKSALNPSLSYNRLQDHIQICLIQSTTDGKKQVLALILFYFFIICFTRHNTKEKINSYSLKKNGSK